MYESDVTVMVTLDILDMFPLVRIWTRHHWINPRTWNEAEACHLLPTETKTDCVRRVNGAATHWLHCSFPRIVQYHPKERPPLRWWVLQWEKSIRWRSNSPSMWVTSWEPPFQSHLMKISGQSAGLDHWELDCERIVGRVLQSLALGSWK